MSGGTYGSPTGQAIFTDDVSLQVFMEHLMKLVCVMSILLSLSVFSLNISFSVLKRKTRLCTILSKKFSIALRFSSVSSFALPVAHIRFYDIRFLWAPGG